MDIRTEAPVSPLKNAPLPENAKAVGSGWDFEYATTKSEFTFLEHPKNGLLYLSAIPAPDEMARIYPSNYYAFSDEETQPKIIKVVRDFLENRKVALYKNLIPSDSAHVLDIGCGDGRLLHIIQKHTPAGWRFSGIEIGESGAAEARKKGYDVVQGDIEFTDPAEWEGKFDLILMHQLIEHTRSPAVLLERAAKWLKPGGVLSIETPECKGWDFSLFKRRYWGGYHFPRHFFLFNKTVLSEMAHDAGLYVISAKSILSPVFWVHSIHNYCADHEKYKKYCPYLKPTNVVLLAIATAIEIVQLTLTRQTTNLQMILRKR